MQRGKVYLDGGIHFNSPFNIAATGLDISPDKLIETLKYYYDRHKNET